MSRRRRSACWLVAGAALVLLAVSFFGYVAHRDSSTLKHGEATSGEVIGFVQPHGWDFFDNGRLVVRFTSSSGSRTATIWIDNDLTDYRIGQVLPLFIRGTHVRTAREPNDPAPLGTAAMGAGLLGLAGLGRGAALRRPPRTAEPLPAGVTGRWKRWRAWDERAADRMGSVTWRYGVPLFVLCVTPFVVMDIGPAYEARSGGAPGTFVARHADCGGRGGCSYRGDFRSDDGTITRTDVGIASGSSIHAVGDVTSAVDTGDRANVYPPGGGSDWLILTALLIGVVGLSAGWVYWLLHRQQK